MSRMLRAIIAVAAVLSAAYAGVFLIVEAPPQSSGSDWRSRVSESQTLQHMTGEANFTSAPPDWTELVMPGVERPRRVVALFNSAEEFEEEDDHGNKWTVPVNSENNRFHHLAELPLNHAGLVVDFQDVNDPAGLPSPEAMAKYRGVVSWLGIDKCRDPEALLRWYAEQAEAGRRVVLFERTGARFDLSDRPVDPKVEAAAMAALGLEVGGEEVWDPERITVEHESGALTAFERPLDLRLPYWRNVRSIDPDAAVWLRLGRRDANDKTADAVVVGPRASYVMREYALREAKVGERWVRQWQIDPFAFFAHAFGLDPASTGSRGGEPILDFTTVNGSRIFYAHIDGDGMGTISEIDRRSKCGALVRDLILRRYDLPVTASAVVGRVQPPPDAYGSVRDVDLARSIFALPNVEVGSHGLSHPMDWRAGEKAELAVDDIPGYSMNGEGEIARSSRYINEELTLPEKPTRIMLWTGWCNPSEEQLAVASRLGLYNLNGGDPRMDRLYPSYAHMAPPIHRVGAEFQFYTAAANDFILTDDWTPPYYRFGNIVDTFDNTGSPRRVVPVNIYYHFYITQKSSALAGVERAYDWVIDHDVAPLFTGEYVEIAMEFYYGRVSRLDSRRWRVRTGGALRTVRFDGERVDIDVRGGSSGVLGYVWMPELKTTYVHIEGAEATIALADAPPNDLYLVQASHRLERVEPAPDGLTMTITGVGRKKIRLGGAERGVTYDVAFSAPHDPPRSRVVTADDEGQIAFDFEGNGAYRVRVTHK